MEEELGIPIYLDTNALLDLLATIGDGFSLMNKTINYDNEQKSDQSEIKGDFRLTMQPFIQLGLGGLKSKEKSAAKGNTIETEKYHTYGSLMNNLINNLRTKSKIKSIGDSIEDINEGDFIEFKGNFSPNPLLDSLKQLVGLFDFLLEFSELGLFDSNSIFNKNDSLNKNLQNNNSNKSKKSQKNQKNSKKKEENEIKLYKGFCQKLVDDLNDENYQKYIIQNNDLSVVCYLFNDFMRDRAGIELPNGEFKVIGKVTRKITNGHNINLLEGSNIRLSSELVGEMVKSLNNIPEIILPEVYSKIDAPALQIIPIAIYI